MSNKVRKILNQIEELIVDLKIEICDNDFDTMLARKKKAKLSANRAKGGLARAEKLSPGRRKEIAVNAAKKRWGNVKRKDIPESGNWLFNNPRAIVSVEQGLLESAEGKATKINLEEL
jgi:hypothetical protein